MILAGPISLESALAGGAIALVVIGAGAALLLDNAIKRLAGLMIAGFGAVLVLAVLGAPDGAMVAGVAILFAQLIVGVAIVVRLQESYGAIEAGDVDAADRESDARADAP